jgi:hypothetical protein
LGASFDYFRWNPADQTSGLVSVVDLVLEMYNHFANGS